MASTGVAIGHGSVIRIGVGATPTWTTLSGCGDFSFPDQPRADVDVTAMDSPNETEEFIPGLRSGADWTVNKQYVPEDAEDVLLAGLEATGEIVLLEITPKGATVPLQWLGYIKSWTPTIPVKDAMMGALMLRINNKVVD
jgi:hypothetical protein